MLKLDEDLGRKESGVTPLHIHCLTATKVSDLPTTLLTEENLNAGTTDHYLTPTHCAALNPNAVILQKVLEKGGDLTVHDNENWLGIHYAAVSPDGPEVESIPLVKGSLKREPAPKRAKEAEAGEEEEQEEEEEETATKKSGRGRRGGARTTRAAKSRKTEKKKVLADEKEDGDGGEDNGYLQYQVEEGTSRTLMLILSLPCEEIFFDNAQAVTLSMKRRKKIPKMEENFAKIALDACRVRNMQTLMSIKNREEGQDDECLSTALDQNITSALPYLIPRLPDYDRDISALTSAFAAENFAAIEILSQVCFFFFFFLSFSISFLILGLTVRMETGWTYELTSQCIPRGNRL
jgi:hypothetical protein